MIASTSGKAVRVSFTRDALCAASLFLLMAAASSPDDVTETQRTTYPG